MTTGSLFVPIAAKWRRNFE